MNAKKSEHGFRHCLVLKGKQHAQEASQEAPRCRHAYRIAAARSSTAPFSIPAAYSTLIFNGGETLGGGASSPVFTAGMPGPGSPQSSKEDNPSVSTSRPRTSGDWCSIVEWQIAWCNLSALTTISVNTDHVLSAINRHRTAQISFRDALIIETALAGGATRLLTEDLQHGLTMDGLEIENPFLQH